MTAHEQTVVQGEPLTQDLLGEEVFSLEYEELPVRSPEFVFGSGRAGGVTEETRTVRIAAQDQFTRRPGVVGLELFRTLVAVVEDQERECALHAVAARGVVDAVNGLKIRTLDHCSGVGQSGEVPIPPSGPVVQARIPPVVVRLAGHLLDELVVVRGLSKAFEEHLRVAANERVGEFPWRLDSDSVGKREGPHLHVAGGRVSVAPTIERQQLGVRRLEHRCEEEGGLFADIGLGARG